MVESYYIRDRSATSQAVLGEIVRKDKKRNEQHKQFFLLLFFFLSSNNNQKNIKLAIKFIRYIRME